MICDEVQSVGHLRSAVRQAVSHWMVLARAHVRTHYVATWLLRSCTLDLDRVADFGH